MPAMKKVMHFSDAEISSIPRNGRVRLFGTVINVNDNAILLDDKSGAAEIMFENQDKPSSFNCGQKVCVIADIIDGKLFGACAQTVDDFDVQLNKNVRSFVKKFKDMGRDINI